MTPATAPGSSPAGKPAASGNSAAPLVAFPLLADPAGYVACSCDLTHGPRERAYWIGLFRRHFPSLLAEALREGLARGQDETRLRGQAAAALAEFEAVLYQYEARPDRNGRLDILVICHEREAVLRMHGIADPYRLAKERENHAALRLLPAVLAELDAAPRAELPRRVIEGAFAGNIFDLGAMSTLALFESGGGMDFHGTRKKLAPRPWLVDHLDAWIARLARGPAYRRAVIFVDNAGCDIVLGMIPLARELLSRGASVVMTANESPSLNDVTAGELRGLIAETAKIDQKIDKAWRAGSLEVVSSGNAAPLIDLTRISPELAQAASRGPADLAVLQGMGRALESNYDAKFTCDVLKLAMVKDQGVADTLGGKLYDLVMRYDEGRGS